MAETGPEAGGAETRSLVVYDDLVDVKGDNDPSELDMERDLHRQRAEKFGVPFVDPGKRRDMRDFSRKEKFARPGLRTGIDMLSEEEQARRAHRASRFGTSAQGLTWQAPAPEEENEARRRRAAKFGVEFRPVDASGQKDQDLLESRSEIPPPEIPRRPEALHVYGVDVLSTGEILRYFSAYAPTYVEWLNDSSCNVLFADTGTAQRALMGLGRPIASQDLAPSAAGGSTAEAAPTSTEAAMPRPPAEDEAAAPSDAGEDPAGTAPTLSYDRVWFKGADALKHGTRVPLTFRVATVEDVKQTMLNAPSRRLWQGGAGRGRGRGRQPAGRGRGRGRGGEKRSRDGDVEMGDAEASGGKGDAMDADDRSRPGSKQRRHAEEKKVMRSSATMFARAMGDVLGGVVE